MSTVGLLPDRERVADGIHDELHVLRIARIVRFDPLSRTPARSEGIAVGPDALAGAVELLPYRDRIPDAIGRDLWGGRISRNVVAALESAPRAGQKAARPDVRVARGGLIPDDNRGAGRVDCNACAVRVTMYRVDQRGRGPTCSDGVLIREDVRATRIDSFPHCCLFFSSVVVVVLLCVVFGGRCF